MRKTTKETIQNTKLADLLRSFDKTERLRGRRFLESPYFNANERLAAFYEEVLARLDKGKPLEKEALWHTLEGKAPYNDVRFRKYCSDLTKLLEQFLAQRAFEADPVQQQIFLLKATKDRDAQKFNQSVLKEAEAIAEKSPYRDIDYYLNQYLIQRNFYEILDFDTKRSESSNLDEISKNLDLLYFSEKLRISCDALQRKNFITHDYQLSFTPALQTYLNNNLLIEKSPIVAIYNKIYLMLTQEDDESHYFDFKELIQRYGHLLPAQKAVEELYNTAQNYCVRKTNQGKSNYIKETFFIYKLLIENNLIFVNNELNPWTFRNVVFVSLRLQEFEFAETFINEYAIYIPDDMRANAISFNMAQLYFNKKEYPKVVTQLSTIEYEDLTYNLNSKLMLMLSYYELDEFDALESFLVTFDTFLKRRKDFTEDRKRQYRDLIKFTRKLIRIPPGDKNLLRKLQAEVEAHPQFANKGWVLEKITELLK